MVGRLGLCTAVSMSGSQALSPLLASHTDTLRLSPGKYKHSVWASNVSMGWEFTHYIMTALSVTINISQHGKRNSVYCAVL